MIDPARRRDKKHRTSFISFIRVVLAIRGQGSMANGILSRRTLNKLRKAQVRSGKNRKYMSRSLFSMRDHARRFNAVILDKAHSRIALLGVGLFLVSSKSTASII